jgi:hypothetical protein
MNIIKLINKRTKLEKEIDSVLECLEDLPAESEDYTAIVDNLVKLYNIKNTKKCWWKVNPDTFALIVGNLLGIAIILKHEELNVISSKALGFVMRTRV